MLSNPNTFTDISVLSLSNLSIASKLIGNSIPLKLRDSACFIKCFVIRSVFFSTGFKALAIHHLKHWLSAFFILSIAFLLARTFGRGTQELPFNGSIQLCEYQVLQLSEMSTHSHSSEGPRGFFLTRDSKIRSCLLIQEQFNFLI